MQYTIQHRTVLIITDHCSGVVYRRGAVMLLTHKSTNAQDSGARSPFDIVAYGGNWFSGMCCRPVMSAWACDDGVECRAVGWCERLSVCDTEQCTTHPRWSTFDFTNNNYSVDHAATVHRSEKSNLGNHFNNSPTQAQCVSATVSITDRHKLDVSIIKISLTSQPQRHTIEMDTSAAIVHLVSL